ncbi:MAG: hypothetical protein AB7S41_19850 [Parvibaculaceae bacterium]
MPEPDLSNDDISTLSKITENDSALGLPPSRPYRQPSVEVLLEQGLIERTDDRRQYRATKAGLDFLSMRGAGLNEA